jgi:hypothetical protein
MVQRNLLSRFVPWHKFTRQTGQIHGFCSQGAGKLLMREEIDRQTDGQPSVSTSYSPSSPHLPMVICPFSSFIRVQIVPSPPPSYIVTNIPVRFFCSFREVRLHAFRTLGRYPIRISAETPIMLTVFISLFSSRLSS